LNCGGGLGNQIFGYAAGLYFQKRFGRILEVVKPIMKHAIALGYPRPFQLCQFGVQARIREEGLVDRFFSSTNPRLKALHGVVGSALGVQLLREPATYQFHSDLNDDPQRDTTFMVGAWQAAGYVRAVEPELRQQLALKAPPQARNKEYARQIHNFRCPVSIHLRIGDYELVKHAPGSSSEPASMVLSPAYYENTITALSDLFPELTLVVFSDEPARARKILADKKDCLFIEGNDEMTAYEDLRLMSLCKHHIIANSSFSWWGAWLNPDPAKRVFAPKYWGNTHSSYFPDLYPSGWTIIDNL
jgi:hypothetical protein